MSQVYHIGTSGWTYKHWQGKFYPEKLPQKQWFEFYAQQFSTVEINYSFYHWLSESSIANWYAHAPKGFVYTIKAPRTITHYERLSNIERVRDFYHLTTQLKDKLGCHLFQLPPGFKLDEDNFRTVKNFLENLWTRFDNAVEFRHPSWWDKDVYDLFRKNKTAFCTVSSSEMPDDAVVTSEVGYFRFHGITDLACYSAKEMRDWAKKIKKSGARRVYCYFNHDEHAYAVKDARMLRDLLNR